MDENKNMRGIIDSDVSVRYNPEYVRLPPTSGSSIVDHIDYYKTGEVIEGGKYFPYYAIISRQTLSNNALYYRVNTSLSKQSPSINSYSDIYHRFKIAYRSFATYKFTTKGIDHILHIGTGFITDSNGNYLMLLATNSITNYSKYDPTRYKLYIANEMYSDDYKSFINKLDKELISEFREVGVEIITMSFKRIENEFFKSNVIKPFSSIDAFINQKYQLRDDFREAITRNTYSYNDLASSRINILMGYLEYFPFYLQSGYDVTNFKVKTAFSLNEDQLTSEKILYILMNIDFKVIGLSIFGNLFTVISHIHSLVLSEKQSFQLMIDSIYNITNIIYLPYLNKLVVSYTDSSSNEFISEIILTSTYENMIDVYESRYGDYENITFTSESVEVPVDDLDLPF